VLLDVSILRVELIFTTKRTTTAWGLRRRLRLLSVVAPLLALCSCEQFVLLSCACACDLLISLRIPMAQPQEYE